MSLENEYAKKAFENGEIFELLMGYKYMITYPYQFNVPVNVTDIDAVLKGLYELYKNTNDNKIIEDIINALKKSIEGSPYEIWFTVHVLLAIFWAQHKKENTFFIDKKNFADFKKKIQDRKSELEAYNPYGGKATPANNAYLDIQGLLRYYKKDYNEELF